MICGSSPAAGARTGPGRGRDTGHVAPVLAAVAAEGGAGHMGPDTARSGAGAVAEARSDNRGRSSQRKGPGAARSASGAARSGHVMGRRTTRWCLRRRHFRRCCRLSSLSQYDWRS